MLPTLTTFIALRVLLALLPVSLFLIAWSRRRDALIFLGVFAVAAVVHAAMPWGPTDFAEADRLSSLWQHDASPDPRFSSVLMLMELLHDLGVPALALFRWMGPMAAALAVALAFACARAGDLGRAASVLAAAILLSWPAHLRYGAAILPMVGPALWLGIYALALTQLLPPLVRVPLVAAAMVYSVGCRPEMLLVCAASWPLVFAPGWRWSHRLALAALLAAGVMPGVIAVAHGELTTSRYAWERFVPWLLHDPAMNPAWWMIAGLAGLVVGRLALPLRAAMAFTIGLMIYAFAHYAAEDNPLWGTWRNVVVLAPLASVAAAGLVDAVTARVRDPLAWTLVAATLVYGALDTAVLFRALDGQAEFAYLRESAARIARSHPDLVLATIADVRPEWDLHPGTLTIPLAANPSFALDLTLGTHEEPRRCADARSSAAVHLWSLDRLFGPCAKDADPAKTALYLGLFRPPALVAQLERDYRLEPIEERVVAAAPTMQLVDTQCAYPTGTLIGSGVPDCELRLGWYTPVRRR